MTTPSLILTNHVHNTKVTFHLYGNVDATRLSAEQRLIEHRADQLNATREPAKSLPLPYRASRNTRSDFDDEFEDIFDVAFQSTGR